MSGESFQLRARDGPSRCPFCHEQVESDQGTACTACAAPHHAGCWQETVACAACGARGPAPAEATPRAESWSAECRRRHRVPEAERNPATGLCRLCHAAWLERAELLQEQLGLGARRPRSRDRWRTVGRQARRLATPALFLLLAGIVAGAAEIGGAVLAVAVALGVLSCLVAAAVVWRHRRRLF